MTGTTKIFDDDRKIRLGIWGLGRGNDRESGICPRSGAGTEGIGEGTGEIGQKNGSIL